MSFLDLLALRKAKLGGKYQAPEEQRHEVAGELNQEEVRDEESEEVRDEVRDKVSEEEDQRNEVRNGGHQKRNLSIVKIWKMIQNQMNQMKKIEHLARFF